MRTLLIIAVGILTCVTVCAQKKEAFSTKDYVRALKHTTDVMVNDVTTPVAASRYYAYISLAANEAACQFKKQQERPGTKAGLYTAPVISDEIVAASNAPLAIVLAIYQAGTRFLPSGYLLKQNVDSLLVVAAKRRISKQSIVATTVLVKSAVDAAVSYAYTDGFVKMSGMRRFTPSAGDEFWQPTGPGFMSAIEPYWATLRPFIIDSVAQVSIDPPAKYSSDSTSDFYRQMLEVYHLGRSMTEEQRQIAMYWDCNPFALQQVGHLEFGIKKISPGGHWIGITGIACKKAKLDIYRAAFVHALVSSSMADAFICCWNTKYKYNRVRPETAIRRLVDKNWRPLLQTPPFPEYTSGHSVVSAVSAAVLTSLFGTNFSFVDDTEVEFGLQARSFKSFDEAAKEAAISRLYGGIHYRDAIDNGRKEGEQIASLILNRFKLIGKK